MFLLMLALGALIFSVFIMGFAMFGEPQYDNRGFWIFVAGFWGVIISIASIIQLAK